MINQPILSGHYQENVKEQIMHRPGARTSALLFAGEYLGRVGTSTFLYAVFACIVLRSRVNLACAIFCSAVRKLPGIYRQAVLHTYKTCGGLGPHVRSRPWHDVNPQVDEISGEGVVATVGVMEGTAVS